MQGLQGIIMALVGMIAKQGEWKGELYNNGPQIKDKQIDQLPPSSSWRVIHVCYFKFMKL